MRHVGTSVLAAVAAALLLVRVAYVASADAAATRPAGGGVTGALALVGGALALAVAAALRTRIRPWLLALAGLALGATSILLEAVLGGRPRVIPGIVLIAAAGAAFAPQGFLRGSPLLRTAAVALQVLILLPFVAIGLIAPLWAVAVLFAVWAGLLAYQLRLASRRPALALAVPPITLALMAGLFALGATVFSWQP